MKLKQIRIDGYKNLTNCKVSLGDFNVLVGSNNCGKSNLLEAMQMLYPICFGDSKLRELIFHGVTPPSRLGSSICHLEKHKNSPMTIGICFETTIGNDTWMADYEVKIQCDRDTKKESGFVSEILTAKIPSKTGPSKSYIRREDKVLHVLDKEHPIAKDNSSLLAIGSLYPEFENLPAELNYFVEAIKLASSTQIFAFSPESLRNDINSEKSIEGTHVCSFDLCLVADQLQSEQKYYDLFNNALCDILDLEKVVFNAQDIDVPGEQSDPKKKKHKRVRFLFIKRKGDSFSFIDEYSDGTLVVTAILEALFSEKNRGPILCLEEMENCLHPAAVERLLRFLQDHASTWPVLITTHSPYLLNGVNPLDVSVGVINETGATEFRKVENNKQLKDFLKSGFTSFGELLPSNFESILSDK
jgi:predicted ATPase